MAVAGATGISAGSAHTIGALLIPEVGGFRFHDLEEISLVREDLFEGARCIVVGGTHPRSGEVLLWIEPDNFWLRKYSRSGKFPSEEIRRNIHVNDIVSEAEFERSKSEQSGR